MNGIGTSIHQDLLTNYTNLLDYNEHYTLVAFFKAVTSNQVFVSALEELIEFTSEESKWLESYTESLKENLYFL
ncbi:hypothetical protein [Bacillus cereus]